MGRLGAAKRLMLSSAMRPPEVPLAPFMGVVVPLGTAAGAIVAAQILGLAVFVGGAGCIAVTEERSAAGDLHKLVFSSKSRFS